MDNTPSTVAERLKESVRAQADGFGDVAYLNCIAEQGEVFAQSLEPHEVHSESGNRFVGDYGLSPDAPESLHEEIRAFVRSVNPEVGACYHNALRFAEVVGRASYVEGHACNSTGDFQHAWNLVDGYVVDTTLAAEAYYGVVIDDETVKRCLNIGYEEDFWGVLTNLADDTQYLRDHGYL